VADDVGLGHGDGQQYGESEVADGDRETLRGTQPCSTPARDAGGALPPAVIEVERGYDQNDQKDRVRRQDDQRDQRREADDPDRRVQSGGDSPPSSGTTGSKLKRLIKKPK